MDDVHEPTPADDVVIERPAEAMARMTSPLALAGTAVAGFAMGAAEVVPGFSGGTVALVAGIYERLVANIRQGTHVLALLLRGRPPAALQALRAVEWPFLTALLAGMAVALLTLTATLAQLIEEQPIAMSAVFLGLVVGAAIVSVGELRQPNGLHGVIVVLVAAVTFVGLGSSPGTVDDPSLLLLFGGIAIAVCAWILPGISGSFLLLLFGLYTATIDIVGQRDIVGIAVLALGAGLGLAGFSTLLNWLLSRYHDLVLAALIGLMLGSARVLWPWPSETGLGDPQLGAPDGDTVFLATALALAALGSVWVFGLLGTAIERRRHAVSQNELPHAG